MEKIYFTIFLGCMMFIISSCSTTTKFTVSGEPGTQILTPDKEEILATIDNTGKVKIANDDDYYYAFLVSHKPGTDEFIPFALDYKKKSHIGSALTEGIGITVAVAGIGGMISGLLAEINGDEEVAKPFIVGGGVASLVGTGMGGLGYFLNEQLNHEYCFKYLKTQTTNQDIRLTRPVLESAKVNSSSIQDSPNIKKEPVESDNTIPNSSVSNKTLNSSISTKKLKDYASKIEGTYVGSGTLKQESNLIEDYSKIKVTIKKQTKDVVLVNVVESDGSKFFSSDGEYTIKKNSNGSYSLTLKGIKNATIEIDTKNNLIYSHSRVNIDSKIYTLSINAKKQ